MSIKAWNDRDEAELIRLYTKENIKDVYQLSSIFGKGYRSVISKLVQLKIYEKPQISDQDKTRTVKVMLRELENTLEIRLESANLNKKENLTMVLDAIKDKIC